MNKEEFIRKYGKEAWKRRLAQVRVYHKAHKEGDNARSKRYNEVHPEQAKANDREANRKGGKHYARKQKYNNTGLQGAKNIIRAFHRRLYQPYKRFIDPKGLSQIHHEWIPGTAEHLGVALVEKDQHMHGFIDVIKILKGKITHLTEAEIRESK